MTVDEQELGRLLQATAELASPPGFTADELTRRAGRRRARIVTAALGAVAAVAAIAVIIPSALSGSSGPSPIKDEGPPAPAPPITPTYALTVNGRTQDVLGHTPVVYAIKPGEKLTMTVDLTIPARTRVTVTGLWMGITNGLLSPTYNGPRDMSPILVAHPRAALGPGTYKFTLHWVAPASLRPGSSRQLSTEFTYPDGGDERIVAVFNVPEKASLGY
jgi:hypothetical protein